jgi:glycosyltransferase involved in cell wall biosynthesis
LKLKHGEGPQAWDEFSIREIAKQEIVYKAIREKVRLTLSYRCFGGALKRGAKILLAGKFGEFRKKMMKGLVDTRVMQLGSVEQAEVNGAWWRRNALPAEEAARVQTAIDAMIAPPPISILLPIDNLQLDHARLSAHSVRRQLYPHWNLFLVAAGGHELDDHLERLLGPDPRVTILRLPKWAGRAEGIAQAVSRAQTERMLVLPPGIELREHALYHLAEAERQQPTNQAFGLKLAVGISDKSEQTIWSVPTRRFSDAPPHAVTLTALRDWATKSIPEEERQVLDTDLAFPIDDRPLLAKRGTAKKAQATKPLWLGADVRGIGGYDHVTYAFLKGLPSFGLELKLHPTALVRADLVPPDLMPPIVKRVREPMLVCGPPFLAPRFGLLGRTAVYTMWETNKLHPKWIPQLNDASLIIVPSEWQRQCFAADGITTPMAVAPLGFDPLVYHPKNRTPEICTFGTAGALSSGGLRKNAQWVVERFREAFPDRDDVRLRVKITPGSPGVETYDDPRIDVIRAYLPHQELAEWYRSLTAYINGSYGEGFGLHLVEAMACGRPLISTHFSGLTAFFDAEVGYVVKHRLVEAQNDIYQGQWAEPVPESLIETMQQVADNPATAEAFGQAAAQRAKEFTWKAAGKQLVAALEQHGFWKEPA